jgi:hypothetical protein
MITTTFPTVLNKDLPEKLLEELWELSNCKSDEGPAWSFLVELETLRIYKEDIENDKNENSPYYSDIYPEVCKYIKILEENNYTALYVKN